MADHCTHLAPQEPPKTKTKNISSYQGEILKLAKITRSEMGAYLCIASNNVPPTVSKRIMVNVQPFYQCERSVYGLGILRG
ncbi:unnamed protein product [Timema podura]|uniref:Ig-like domain-containing protein n=1 Tax=Timema podura TaxID=61482 RepID=A0ABN7NMZ2_TIMPD|nr:unnamed protein product [Timema podura]